MKFPFHPLIYTMKWLFEAGFMQLQGDYCFMLPRFKELFEVGFE